MDASQIQDLVRQEYKRYKRKKPPPDFSDVIDFNNTAKFQDRIERISGKDTSLDYHSVGLRQPSQWEVYKVLSCEGFMFIKNPFEEGATKCWSWKALTAYTKRPFPCNLDVHMKLDDNKSVWEISKLESPTDPYKFMEKLRWTHLGYHFDYNYVNYKEEKYYGFPEDLSQLMKCISTGLGFEDYSPETAIVNYYPIGSSMGGHTDHYEEELDAPLISVSFGLPAVFLIGGQTKDIQPQAIWIRSGDIVIMSGSSRTAYHAVPCIVEEKSVEKNQNWRESLTQHDNEMNSQDCRNEQADSDPCFVHGNSFREDQCFCNSNPAKNNSENMPVSKEDQILFENYLSKTRININARQVHKKEESKDKT